MIDPLDALLADAQREAARRRVKPAPSEKPKHPILPSGFSDPTNWKRTRTVALIHQPSQTLLGNFHEFLYDQRGVHARKLVRVNEPTDTDGMELVSGDWWLNAEAERHADPQRWIETRDVTIGMTLAECGLHAPAVAVHVRLEFGGIARVELAEDTRFFCVKRDTFLIVAAGVDVLQAMSFDSKLALRAELRLGEDETDE